MQSHLCLKISNYRRVTLLPVMIWDDKMPTWGAEVEEWRQHYDVPSGYSSHSETGQEDHLFMTPLTAGNWAPERKTRNRDSSTGNCIWTQGCLEYLLVVKWLLWASGKQPESIMFSPSWDWAPCSWRRSSQVGPQNPESCSKMPKTNFHYSAILTLSNP